MPTFSFVPHEKRHFKSSIPFFVRAGFKEAEAEVLVKEFNLRASNKVGRAYRKHRRAEVDYYMKELGLSEDAAIDRAVLFREELNLHTESPPDAFGDALKWDTRYVTESVVWRGGDSKEQAVKHFMKVYIGGKPVGDWF